MALELVFVCPLKICKLRSGPLGKLFDGYCDWLLECGFSQSTIRKHLSNVSHFNGYLDEQKVTDRQTLSAEDVNGFLKEYPLRIRFREPSENHQRTICVAFNGR